MLQVCTPFELAKQVYENEPCARTFEQDLETHLALGYVISCPEFFVMARPVEKSASRKLIVNPEVRFLEPDCWHIYLMAGAWWHVFGMSPLYYPWVSFERQNKLRFYEYERILKYAVRLYRKEQSSATLQGCGCPRPCATA